MEMSVHAAILLNEEDFAEAIRGVRDPAIMMVNMVAEEVGQVVRAAAAVRDPAIMIANIVVEEVGHAVRDWIGDVRNVGGILETVAAGLDYVKERFVAEVGATLHSVRMALAICIFVCQNVDGEVVRDAVHRTRENLRDQTYALQVAATTGICEVAECVYYGASLFGQEAQIRNRVEPVVINAVDVIHTAAHHIAETLQP